MLAVVLVAFFNPPFEKEEESAESMLELTRPLQCFVCKLKTYEIRRRKNKRIGWRPAPGRLRRVGRSRRGSWSQSFPPEWSYAVVWHTHTHTHTWQSRQTLNTFSGSDAKEARTVSTHKTWHASAFGRTLQFYNRLFAMDVTRMDGRKEGR